MPVDGVQYLDHGGGVGRRRFGDPIGPGVRFGWSSIESCMKALGEVLRPGSAIAGPCQYLVKWVKWGTRREVLPPHPPKGGVTCDTFQQNPVEKCPKILVKNARRKFFSWLTFCFN